METGSQYRIYSVANHALSPKRVTDPKNGKDWLIDIYHKVSNIRRTKLQKLNVSRLVV